MTRIPVSELSDSLELEFRDDLPPCSFVSSGVDVPAAYDKYVLLDTVHDGWTLPERFVQGFTQADLLGLDEVYRRERDWGASWVAMRLAQRLRLSGFHRVNVARALLDFNRFPGSTQPDVGHLDRLAINPPFSETLTYEQKADVFTNYYDKISEHFDDVLRTCSVKIAIHTYDTHNLSGTERPAISLITRPAAYQLKAKMPTGAFDALFPSILGEFLASRVLVYRIALSMERKRIPVALDFPYLAPDGAVEVRSQVWFFFNYLRRRYEAANRYASSDEAASFRLVWAMLLDTNTRSSATVAFREYLHAFRRPPGQLEGFFERGRKAYDRIRAYLHDHWAELVDQYRYSPWRPSALGLEVRKDFLFDFENGVPTHLKISDAERAVEGIAEGIEAYLEYDLGVNGPDIIHVGEGSVTAR
jgi:hypothetical protein